MAVASPSLPPHPTLDDISTKMVRHCVFSDRTDSAICEWGIHPQARRNTCLSLSNKPKNKNTKVAINKKKRRNKFKFTDVCRRMAEPDNNKLLPKNNHANGTDATCLDSICLDPHWSQPNIVLAVTDSDESVRCSAVRDLLIRRREWSAGQIGRWQPLMTILVR